MATAGETSVAMSSASSGGTADAGMTSTGMRARFRRWWTRLRRATADDRGMATAEYAMVTLAACALAVVLYKLVTSPAVKAMLQSLLERALHAQV
ncbi:DUF4244 domain-containing protein [Streptomyces sp. NBRC 110611]|uniref:DUF4244 domain-containing protein n=1 Tax=Streptomyces sp. NBRC 110611 TaxID=1621259 RepID=UPI00215CB509|nr:DUF4244 domain-containing protein [Streptomyces sp. NBRC 110611]